MYTYTYCLAAGVRPAAAAAWGGGVPRAVEDVTFMAIVEREFPAQPFIPAAGRVPLVDLGPGGPSPNRPQRDHLGWPGEQSVAIVYYGAWGLV